MKLNKKAMMDDWMDLMFTIIMGLLIFFFIFSFTSAQNKAEDVQIQNDIEDIDYGALLLHYVMSDTDGNLTADLISEAYLKGNYDKVEGQAKEIFAINNFDCWKLRFSVDDSQVKSMDDEFCIPETITKVAELYLPINDKPDKNIKLELFKATPVGINI